VHSISDKSLHEVHEYIEEIEYPRGHILSEEGKVEHYLYFLHKGIVRAYTTSSNGDEITFWFGMEGDIVCSMMNYIEKKPSYESIELLEDCSLSRIPANRLKELYLSNLEWANWGRKYIEHEVIKAENRLIKQQFLTATERYQSLLKEKPELLQRVPLGMIASFLGMTQVSLSRIRGKI